MENKNLEEKEEKQNVKNEDEKMAIDYTIVDVMKALTEDE